MPVVAIVGYTNAGKSTLFNALTAAGVVAENRLFATLDPTTRHLTLPTHQEILLTDTVGFIQKLPTSLIAAFRATLEEVVEADLLLEIVDITHENAIEQSETVNDVLAELGAADKPRATALNKVDRLAEPESVDTTLFVNAVPVSALTSYNLDKLLLKIGEVIRAKMVDVRVRLPFDKGDLVELFHRRGHVASEVADGDGVVVVGSLPRSLLGMFAPYALGPGGRRGAARSRNVAPDTVPDAVPEATATP